LCGEHVNHAFGLLKKYGSEAKWLTGGMSLIPLIKLRLAGPTHLIGPLPVAPSSASGCPQPSQRWCDARSGRGDRHPAARRRAGDVSEQPHYRAAVPGRHFINSCKYGLTALLGLVVATFAAYLLGADGTLIRNGLLGFNGVLTGIAL
jgi:hypothetical protein